MAIVVAACSSAGSGGGGNDGGGGGNDNDGGNGGGSSLTQSQKTQSFTVIFTLALASLGGEQPGTLDIAGDTVTYTDYEYDAFAGATATGTITDANVAPSTQDVDIDLTLSNDPEGVTTIAGDWNYDDSGSPVVATGTITVNGQSFPAQEFYDAFEE
jgi:hypothetical protein